MRQPTHFHREPEHWDQTPRRSNHENEKTAYRSAAGVALAAAFLLVWIALAVGILGVEGYPADLMYVGILAVGFIDAIIARFQPIGMSRALFATALAQALVTLVALILRKHQSSVSSVPEILILNSFFVALFVGSVLLFKYAARKELPRPQGPRVDPRVGTTSSGSLNVDFGSPGIARRADLPVAELPASPPGDPRRRRRRA
jgi:hypothetical protein